MSESHPPLPGEICVSTTLVTTRDCQLDIETYICMYIYIYRYSERERERKIHIHAPSHTHSLTHAHSVTHAQGVGESKTAVSGPEYYGLAYPEIKRFIQELPNADKCATKPLGKGCYKWQNFGDGPLSGPTLSVCYFLGYFLMFF